VVGGGTVRYCQNYSIRGQRFRRYTNSLEIKESARSGKGEKNPRVMKNRSVCHTGGIRREKEKGNDSQASVISFMTQKKKKCAYWYLYLPTHIRKKKKNYNATATPPKSPDLPPFHQHKGKNPPPNPHQPT